MSRDELVRAEGTGIPSMSADPVTQHSLRQGGRLSEQSDLAKLLANQKVGWLPELKIGPFRIDGDDATKHIAFIGAPGSGKTVLMRLLMQSVLPTIGLRWKGRLSEQEVRKDLIRGISSVLGKAAGNLENRVGTPPTGPAAIPEGAQKPQFQTRIIEEPLDPKSQRHREWWLVATRLLGLSFLGFVGAMALGATGAVPLPILSTIGLPFFICAPYWLLVTFSALLLGRRLWPKKRTIREEVAPPPRANLPVSEQPRVAPRYDGPLKWDGHRALIYDAKLEVIPELMGMELACPVHILNPFDARGVAWDMAVDITEPAIAKQIAAIFIPDEKKSSQPYFADASRQLLEGIFVSFILTQGRNWTFRDVLNATKTRDALAGVLSATPQTVHLVETYLSHERETKSTLATLATKLGNFDVVAALWDSCRQKLSLRDWLDSESVLVLGNDEAYRSSLGVINRVIFNRIVELLLARRSTTTGRTWFFLDEVKEAGELDALDRLMTKGRSFGAAVVLGFQNISGLYETFGENTAKSILGQCATKIFLRVDSPETAEWAQSVFGEYEAVELKQSATMGESHSEGQTVTRGTSTSSTESSGRSFSGIGTGATHGTNTSRSDTTSTSESTATTTTSGDNRSLSKSAEVVKRHLVLAAELMHLPMTSTAAGLHGYISHHMGKSRFAYRGFERDLFGVSDHVERVVYRPLSEQFLKPWSPKELAQFAPNSTSTSNAASPSGADLPPASESKTLGDVLERLKSRQSRSIGFLPNSNPENGLTRES